MNNKNVDILVNILKASDSEKNPAIKSALMKSAVRFAKSGDVSRFDVKNALVFYGGFLGSVEEFLSLY